MTRFGQVGIALGALGIVLTLMGLFPGLIGVEPTLGIGVIQVFMLLCGYALLIFGAVVYVKFTFYFGIPINLLQQIGLRLSMTGLLLAALAGLADIFGFGSHLRTEISDIYFGSFQAISIIACFGLSSLGVIMYALAGYRQMRVDAPSPDDEVASVSHP
jgi:hypothetical protein